jgi:hypothetical protein
MRVLMRDALCYNKSEKRWLSYSKSIRLSAENRLRFRIRRGSFEVELEGEFGYVKEKFEELMAQQPSYSGPVQEEARVESTNIESIGGEDLEGVLETGPDGKPHFTIPFDSLTAKEAIGLVLYKAQPTPLGDKELSDLLNASWRTTKPHVIRARASELRKDGRLITEKGKYSLSGAGLQWIRAEVIPSLRGVRSVQS